MKDRLRSILFQYRISISELCWCSRTYWRILSACLRIAPPAAKLTILLIHPFQVRDTVVKPDKISPVSYTHLRAHETRHDLVCRLLLEKKKKKKYKKSII